MVGHIEFPAISSLEPWQRAPSYSAPGAKNAAALVASIMNRRRHVLVTEGSITWNFHLLLVIMRILRGYLLTFTCIAL